MGGRVRLVNDIEILQELLVSGTQIPLQPGPGRPSVILTDIQAKSSLEIKGVPHDSIAIRAEDFEDPLTVFNGSKGERKRADYLIVSNEGGRKWIICIETQAGNRKSRSHVESQLKGALCFVKYCRCIGRSFWDNPEFLDDYQFRFISVVDLNPNRETKTTRPYSPYIQSQRQLHNSPESYLKIFGSSNLYFNKLIIDHSFGPSP